MGKLSINVPNIVLYMFASLTCLKVNSSEPCAIKFEFAVGDISYDMLDCSPYGLTEEYKAHPGEKVLQQQLKH